jgi:hypothetical protein
VKFHVFGRSRIESGSQLVDLTAKPVYLCFKNTDTPKHKVLFCRVAGRTRIVKIQKAHKKGGRAGFRPADRVGSPLNRN